MAPITASRIPTQSRPAFSVFVDGPTATPAQRAALTEEASLLRVDGHAVVTALELPAADAAGYARAAARAVLDADALYLLPGWEDDAHAAASEAHASALRLPVIV